MYPEAFSMASGADLKIKCDSHNYNEIADLCRKTV